MKEQYIPEIKCMFNNERCLCQWCEKPCNDGLQCHECKTENKSMHDTYMCTGFVGTYPHGTTSDEIHEKAMEYLERKKGRNG